METKETLNPQEKKLYTVLELLNTCREKIKALCYLFNTQVLNAKADSDQMGVCLDTLIEKHNDLKGIASVLPKAKKDDRATVAKASKPIVKSTQVSVSDLKKDFAEHYANFKNALTEAMTLRATYKAEVVSCCEAFKKFLASKEVEGSEKIVKGYRQQVKLIKAVLDKIKSLIVVYNQEDEKVEGLKKEFDNMTKIVDRLASDLHTFVTA